MRWLRNLAYSLEEITPMGWLVAGVAALVVLPGVRKGLRSAAVLAASGIMAAGEGLASAASSVSEEVEDIVAEARHRKNTMTRKQTQPVMEAAGGSAVAEGSTEPWVSAQSRLTGKVKRPMAKPGDLNPGDLSPESS
jgi:hypothetical protein